MNVRLFSDDQVLQKMCREILGEFPGRDIHMFEGISGSFTAPMDFYVWDFKQNSDFPVELGKTLSNHLFLVYRKDVDALHESLGRADTFILLKPIRRTTLAAFLGMAVSAYEGRVSTASAVRSDQDEVVRCLIQSNLKLQEVDQDRTDFLARGLHDFRTPLTAILGYCGILRNEALGPLNEYQKEVLERMDHSTRRLSRMASAMFQLSGYGRGKRGPAFDLGDIRECVAQAAHEVRPIADAKRISLTVDLDQNTPLFYFESGLVEQILINLLENACKFTPKGGQIEVRGKGFFWDRRLARSPGLAPSERRRLASEEANAYRIDVLDTGAPIPAEHLQNLFAEDIANSAEPDRSGGGLGLVICRMAAAQHEGRIWAQNTEQGAVFSLVLPYRNEFEKDAAASARAKHSNHSEVYQ
jgi:signal transduction histidine kinase